MAVLSAADRQGVQVDFCRDLSNKRTPFNLSDTDLAAAVAAIDDWIEANQAAFNAAIPQPARTALTAAQKSQIFTLISGRRFNLA